MSLKERPEDKRERLTRSESKNNPIGALNDALNLGTNGSFTDSSRGMGWKDTVILIAVLFFGYVLYKMLF